MDKGRTEEDMYSKLLNKAPHPFLNMGIFFFFFYNLLPDMMI